MTKFFNGGVIMDPFRVNFEDQKLSTHVLRTFSLPPEDDKKLLEISKQKEISISRVIRECVHYALKHYSD